MKNINQDSQGNTDLNTSYQIVNNIPEKQSIVLQNTDKALPIQLRIDPVTDYTALWLTVLASVLVSALSAIVTIYLITRSNNSLINSQDKLQEKMLSQQAELKKNELISQNRQEWINKVRELFVNYFNHSESFPYLLQRNYAARHAYCNYKINDDQHNIYQLEYQKFLSDLKRFTIEIDITLSSKDKIDREISNLANNFYEEFLKLVKYLDQEFTSTVVHQASCNQINYFSNQLISKKMVKINENILEKIKSLLKSEWENVKSFS